MGSNSHDDCLPPADASSLILTVATTAERRRVWALTHQMWGKAIPLEDYIEREAYLTTVPLAMNNGVTHWILTDGTQPPDERPILSSCETLRKPGLAAKASAATSGAADTDSVSIIDGVAHGIASVFTDPQYRGKGYAGRMLRELGPRLKHWQVDDSKYAHSGEGNLVVAAPQQHATKTALFSVLYSDIGKTYYASKGWAPFPSTHLSFSPLPREEGQPEPPLDTVTTTTTDNYSLTQLGYHELTELCPLDVQLLRARLARRAAARASSAASAASASGAAAAAAAAIGPCVALVPDLNTMLWHLMREDYMTKRIFGRTPAVRGAMCTIHVDGPPPPNTSTEGGDAQFSASRKGHRMWAVWTRGYYGGRHTTRGNTLSILHFVLEDLDDDFPDAPGEVPLSDKHVEGFAAIFRLAQREAAAWRCGDVQMWNPTPAQTQLADRCGLSYQVVDRERDSIASLMWYGEEATEGVDWVANEKFGWY